MSIRKYSVIHEDYIFNQLGEDNTLDEVTIEERLELSDIGQQASRSTQVFRRVQ